MEDPSHPVNEESNAVGSTDSPGEGTSAGVGEEGVARRADTGRARRPTPPNTAQSFAPPQRMLILDSWLKSGFSAGDFAPLVGVSPTPCTPGRNDSRSTVRRGSRSRSRRKAPKGSRLPEATQRAILMMKENNPDWGSDRIHLMLMRSEGYMASPGAILRVLKEAGYQSVEEPTRRHEPKVTRFERAKPNQLWQTDLFTFLLKRENRRVYLVGYMDDHSRYLVGWGLHASSSGAMVRETLEAAIANYGAPEEILTDQGTQYYTWRGKSAFSKLLERRGIKQIVATTAASPDPGEDRAFLGQPVWECVQPAIFQGLDDARTRIGHFIDHYNFQRPHQGIDGLVPADRFFGAADEVRKTLESRVAENARDLALHGAPRKTVYLTGKVGNESIALHGEGSKVILTREDGGREEVDLAATGKREEP